MIRHLNRENNVRNLNQARFPSIGKWMNTVLCLNCYAAVQTNKLDVYVLRGIMVSEMLSFTKIHTVWMTFIYFFKPCKATANMH